MNQQTECPCKRSFRSKITDVHTHTHTDTHMPTERSVIINGNDKVNRRMVYWNTIVWLKIAHKWWVYLSLISHVAGGSTWWSQHSHVTRDCNDPCRHGFCESSPWSLIFLTPKINGLPGLIVKHLCVTFGGPSCIVFETSADKQTDRQTSTACDREGRSKKFR